MVIHNINPIYDHHSTILILGSFPSVKSREACFFYQHPQNRFWKIMTYLFNDNFDTIENKKNNLLKYHIALWDVIESCDISGSSDSTIKNVQINDLNKIINCSQIKTVFTNGKKAYELYNKYCYKNTKIKPILLPSSSPANATYSLDKLCQEWSIIKQTNIQ